MTFGTMEVDKGENIFDAACRAVRLANKYEQKYRIVFNDIELEVSPDSLPGDICIIYDLKIRLRKANKQLEILDLF